MNKILLNEPLTKMATPQEKAQCVSWFIETKNRICRLGETSELNMEEIHRRVHQFVHGTRNLWGHSVR